MPTVKTFACLRSRGQGHDRLDRRLHVLESDENLPQKGEII